MIALLAPTHSHLGAGARCDPPVLPELEIYPRLHTGITEQSQPGDASAAGACLHARKSGRIIQLISHENAHDACGHRHTEWKF